MTGRYPNNHDVILGYQKSEDATWNQDEVFVPYDARNLDEKTAGKYCHKDPDGRLYQLDNLNNPNPDRPNLTYEFLGVTRVWRWTKERMQAAYDAGLVVQTKPGRVPRLKRYLDEQRGRPLGDVWTDIPPLNSQAKERLGYPTQKPEALIERLIRTSTNEGDVVLDPFCGCGTTVEAAQNLGRRWVGIDISYDAIRIIRDRLVKAGIVEKQDYEVWGEPESLEDAIELAEEDKYQFQWWAVRRLGAREIDYKKGADERVDGRLVLRAERSGRRLPEAIISVKAGRKSGPHHVSELRGVIERENAEIGVLVTRGKPTKAMKAEASKAGEYTDGKKWFPRIQLLSAEEIICGKGVNYPAFLPEIQESRDRNRVKPGAIRDDSSDIEKPRRAAARGNR